METEEQNSHIDSDQSTPDSGFELSKLNYYTNAVRYWNLIDKNRAKKRTLSRLRRAKLTRLIRYTGGVAAIAAVTLLIIYVLPENLVNGPAVEKQVIIADNQCNVPTVILSNGDTIQLDDSDRLSSSWENQTTSSDSLPKDSLKLNTIIIPRGYSNSITLPDGTIVWLNACSKLSYSDSFSQAAERVVRLEGEGFFDVSKKSQAFKVIANGVEIKAYGTKFNVKCDPHRDIVETVLVNGKVGIRFENQFIDEVFLTPNQIAQTNLLSHKSTITNVDVYKYTAWVKGFFVFEDMTMEQITTELSKWYDVDFQFLNKKAMDYIVIASFSRNLKVDEILIMLSDVSNAKFRTEGRNIYVE